MKFVQPIRDTRKLKKIELYLKENNQRDYIMFMLGIYTGLRVSDILILKVKDVTGNFINIQEKKTKKINQVEINPLLKKALKLYVAGKPRGEYLIKSRRGKNKPISRTQAYRRLREAANEFELSNIGTHSMRKTFGYHYYKQTKDIATLQSIFNHGTPKYTLRYIGVDQDRKNKAIRDFRYY